MLIEEHVPVCRNPQVELFTVRSEGAAGHALLVIHGGPDWDHTFLLEPLVTLAETHRLVFADLRGCGRSTTGTAEWSRPFLAGTLPSGRPEDSLTRLVALDVPILLLHGRQDMTFPAALTERTATEMPNARAVILDQAGHMAHIDEPEAWLQAITEFLG